MKKLLPLCFALFLCWTQPANAALSARGQKAHSPNVASIDTCTKGIPSLTPQGTGYYTCEVNDPFGYAHSAYAASNLCPANCERCFYDDRSCVYCKSGYNVATDGSCIVCPAHCKECDTTASCSVCYDGYALTGGKCVEKVSCPSNCAECDSSGVCVKCNNGYVLKNGACAVKPKTQIAFCPPDKTLSADLCCCVSK